MKGSTVLKVIGVAAAIDFIDMAAKGQFLAWLKLAHPDAAKEWNSITGNQKKLWTIRPKMIDKMADIIIEIYTKM